jgi:NADPH:quinone reductase-like Zn-dependent oxidoreductase
MEAYRIDRFGSIDGIVLRSSEDPRPGPKEILMRVRASSLNYRDLMVLKGGGRGPTKLGVVPLSDGAGEVAAIGDGVTRVKLGDRVIGTFHPRWFGGPLSADYLTDRLGANLDGMLAEYAVLSEEALVPMPSHLSFEEASTLPCAAVTAWVALTRHRRVTAGDTVLTQGSGGRLGLRAAICPGLGRPSDRDHLDRGEGRAAQGAGCLRGDRLCRDAGLG